MFQMVKSEKVKISVSDGALRKSRSSSSAENIEFSDIGFSDFTYCSLIRPVDKFR